MIIWEKLEISDKIDVPSHQNDKKAHFVVDVK